MQDRKMKHSMKRIAAILWCLGLVIHPLAQSAAPFSENDSDLFSAKTSRPKTGPMGAADLLRYAPEAFEIRTPPQLPAVPPRIVHHGPRHAPRIALTFDACATRVRSGYDERLIQVLSAKRTPATLFLGGKWMAEHPAATRYLGSQDLFELANHSFFHPHLVKMSEDQVRQELWWTQAAMFSLTGRQALLFRAPHVELDERVVRVAARMGLTTVQYDLAAGDPDPGATTDRLIKRVSQGVRNGSIVVMHMNGRGWHTAEALPVIIDELHRRGFSFTTVGDLIRSGW
jgi:peptidoglycan/xylan/chitin deacetylase (PgdA/CDA1 family)